MSKNSKIEWTDHTFNPWIGCTKVSPGCANCYAAAQDKFRKWTPQGWGKGKPRKGTSDAYWKQPLKWNRLNAHCLHCGTFGEMWKHCLQCGHYLNDAEDTPEHRPRVFSASLADWLDDEVPIEYLADFLKLVFETPNLDWLLLTKRPENFPKRALAAGLYLMGYRDGQTGSKPTVPAMLPEEQMETFLGWAQGEVAPANVWIGTTVENQEMADKRIPELLKIPAKVRFLSCEPLLGPVALKPEWVELELQTQHTCFPRVNWVICGGESGSGARPMHPDWARSLRDQCQAAGVPFFFKQWGEWSTTGEHVGSALIHNDGKVSHPKYEVARIENPRGGRMIMFRVGKKAAGRLLEGREWSEFPKTDSLKAELQPISNPEP
jgi:protein gp37